MPAHRFTSEQAAPLIYFANERHEVYLRKQLFAGDPIPAWANPMGWKEAGGTGAFAEGKLTADSILLQYRFCNVFRELDRVTVWIRENISEPFADHEHLWFMLAIARFINWPPTLWELICDQPGAWPSHESFSPQHLTYALEDRKARGNKVETSAYMIRAESDPKKAWYSWSKQRYISEIVLGEPWEMRRVIVEHLTHRQRSLEEVWNGLTSAWNNEWTGWGPFMVGQIVADLRHTRYLARAPDVGYWAPIGPGSMRGLNRLAERPLKQNIHQSQALDEMLQLQSILNASTGPHVPFIELHDVQNCLCETDKMLRVKMGEGKPRSLYVPGRGC